MKLPAELKDMVSQHMGYGMTLDEAKEHRLKLMEERTVARDNIARVVFGRSFDLCEH